MAKKNSKIKMDEFIASAIPDPKNHEPLKILRGFIGASSVKDHIRIYADESLNTFIEIPEKAVVHSMELPKTISPLGGSWLWVKKNAEYIYGSPADKNRPKAKFLEGDLYNQYKKQSPYIQKNVTDEFGMPLKGPDHTSILETCPSSEVCPTAGCTPGCPSTHCPTYSGYCPTEGCTPGCPTPHCLSHECPEQLKSAGNWGGAGRTFNPYHYCR